MNAMTNRSEMPVLILREGTCDHKEWPLSRTEMTIGRDASNDIVLPDRQVSRLHARVYRVGAAFYIEDCQSKNGTYVNGKPVTEPYRLQDGDEIQIAVRFRLLFVDAESTAPLLFGKETIGLHLDERSRRVWVNGQELWPPLSAPQFAFLALLYANEGSVVSREEIVQVVWPDAQESGITDQAIDALARRVRERIAALDPDHRYVITIRGHGFMFQNPA